eukprot:TRINITY_DN5475_c0_g1_i6.p1 TRINITY_DN5475_c0_g1~~TRINITY_DN5475_c0_g1_i6.p1  ORF type:complete len:508 (-),score=66.35 TRINITY_DN5475_c0_g1_i6:150-1673(-)
MAGRSTLVSLVVFVAFAPTINVVAYRMREAYEENYDMLSWATSVTDTNKGGQQLTEVKTRSNLSQSRLREEVHDEDFNAQLGKDMTTSTNARGEWEMSGNTVFNNGNGDMVEGRGNVVMSDDDFVMTHKGSGNVVTSDDDVVINGSGIYGLDDDRRRRRRRRRRKDDIEDDEEDGDEVEYDENEVDDDRRRRMRKDDEDQEDGLGKMAQAEDLDDGSGSQSNGGTNTIRGSQTEGWDDGSGSQSNGGTRPNQGLQAEGSAGGSESGINGGTNAIRGSQTEGWDDGSGTQSNGGTRPNQGLQAEGSAGGSESGTDGETNAIRGSQTEGWDDGSGTQSNGGTSPNQGLQAEDSAGGSGSQSNGGTNTIRGPQAEGSDDGSGNESNDRKTTFEGLSMRESQKDEIQKWEQDYIRRKEGNHEAKMVDTGAVVGNEKQDGKTRTEKNNDAKESNDANNGILGTNQDQGELKENNEAAIRTKNTDKEKSYATTQAASLFVLMVGMTSFGSSVV